MSVQEAQVIQVIKTVSSRGEGVPGDPIRPVEVYWSLDGKVLAVRDRHFDDVSSPGHCPRCDGGSQSKPCRCRVWPPFLPKD